jgi:predicted phage replisome organizer
MEKRYYWLKFRSDFFDSKRIKKLRNMAGGDTYCIIYLKMQLKALNSNGVLEFTGIEEDFADELALDIDERPDDVKVTLLFLLQYGLCECSDNIHYYLPWVAENSGSETASTQRSRECRKRKALQCNTDATEVQRLCNVEKEKEIDKSREEKKRFVPPTLDEVKARCSEKGYTLDPVAFMSYYNANGWKVGRTKMVSWIDALAGWESREKQYRKPKKQNGHYAMERDRINEGDFNKLIVNLEEDA